MVPMNDEITINQDELMSEAPRSRGSRFPNWPHWRRALKWLGFTLLLAIIAVAAFLYINIAKISINPFGFGSLKGESLGRVNIMMLGVGDPGHDGENLSDTDMVISLNTRTHQIALISIPRDTRVPIPGNGYGKINNANAYGGVSLAKTVFQNTLGIPIDYYVKANFTGLREVVDAVGGVDVNNTTYLSDSSYPCDNNQYRSCGFTLAPGHYHLNGTTALKYVRCRKGTCGDDFGRATRQQQVMQSIRSRAASAGTLGNPVALAKLVSAAGGNIQTDLSLNNMLRLDQLTKQTASSNIFSIVFNLLPDGFLISDPQGSSDLLPVGGDFSQIQTFVQSIFTQGPIWAEHPTVVIENGTTTPGIGGKFSQKLKDDGYDVTVSAVTNALTQDHTTSQVIDYSGGKDAHTLAYLESLLKLKQATPPAVPTKYPPADIVVILGSDYAASLAPATTTPAAQSGGTTTGQ